MDGCNIMKDIIFKFTNNINITEQEASFLCNVLNLEISSGNRVGRVINITTPGNHIYQNNGNLALIKSNLWNYNKNYHKYTIAIKNDMGYIDSSESKKDNIIKELSKIYLEFENQRISKIVNYFEDNTKTKRRL